VKVEGATLSWPRTLDGVQPGDVRTVYAEIPRGSRVRLDVAGKVSSPVLRPVPRPLLERSWAKAKIASLLDEKGLDPAAVAKQVVALSVAHRVVSPYTAMLVLETDDDYQRFEIDRRAAADILTIERGAFAVAARRAAPPDAARDRTAPPSRPAPVAEAANVMKAPAWPEAPGDPLRGPLTTPPVAAQVDVSPTAGAASGYAYAFSDDPLSPPRPQYFDMLDSAAAPAGGGAGPNDATIRVRAGGSRLDGADHARAAARADSMMFLQVGNASASYAQSPSQAPDGPAKAAPYAGRFKDVMDALAKKDMAGAASIAADMHDKDPGDVLGLVAVGEVAEANGDTARAARAYGSIIDLFPARADLRRFAGERLERVAASAGLDLALDTYTKANEQRPDHPSSHRLLAFALLKKALYAKAFDAIVAGLTQKYPENRFASVDRVLREDLGLVGAAWGRAEPARGAEIRRRVAELGGAVEGEPSVRFVLTWETDANDVDLHVYDKKGGHAFYSHPDLPSGGSLYADVTTGYGPECFTIRAPRDKRQGGPYTLQANYYSRGPMGYGMGKLEIIEHDGAGHLTFEERPYVVMVDHAYVDLGSVP
jgi:hypothetical protein